MIPLSSVVYYASQSKSKIYCGVQFEMRYHENKLMWNLGLFTDVRMKSVMFFTVNIPTSTGEFEHITVNTGLIVRKLWFGKHILVN